MTFPGMLIRSDQGWRSQQNLWIALQLRDLVALTQEKGLNSTAPPTEQYIMALMFGEGRSSLHLERNILVGKIPSKGKLHRGSSHRVTKRFIPGVSHPMMSVWNRMERVGDSTFGQVTGVGEGDQVGGRQHDAIKVPDAFWRPESFLARPSRRPGRVCARQNGNNPGNWRGRYAPRRAPKQSYLHCEVGWFPVPP